METLAPGLSNFNKEVKMTYNLILHQAKALLATLEKEELRYTLIRADRLSSSTSKIIHELVNPLLYLRLESDTNGKLGIRYGFEPSEEYQHITLAFTRMLYKVTMQEATSTNIEECIQTRFFIHNPDEMYYYVEEQMKHHTFKLIKYKKANQQRKQLRVVA